MSSRLNHPGVTAVVTAVCIFIFLVLRLNQRDPGTFPQAGEVFTNTTITPGNIIAVTEFTGYDGQFYYRLALDPFTREQTDFGIQIDSPRYRHQRILYPLLAWIGSFGSPPLVADALILVNFLALIWLGYSAGQFAKLAGRHALWGLTFSLYPGFLLTHSRDLAEIVEAAFVLAGILALQQKRHTIASAVLSLAILAKETALLTAVSFITQRKIWKVAILPLAVYGLWQLFMNWWWGYVPSSSVSVNIGWPIWGILRGFRITNDPQRWLIEVGLLGLFVFIVFVSLHRSKAELYIKAAFIFYFALLLVLTENIWLEDWAFLRAAALGVLFGTAVLLQTKSRIANVCLIGVCFTWLWLAVNLLTT